MEKLKKLFLAMPTVFLLSVFFSVSFSGCSTSPTGRRQLKLLPESQMGVMGAQAFSQMKTQTPVSRDQKVEQYVRCISIPLIRELDYPDMDPKLKDPKNWEIVVFDQPETVNAFALPGGKIGVYTGLLKVAANPDQLAAVIGHEIGHVLARHGNERVSEAMAAQGGLTLAGIMTQNNPKRQWIMGLLGVGAQFGILLPHGRTQESEADTLGLDLMSKAGFNPQESVELWKNMGKGGTAGPIEFLSTHPSHETRIKRLQERMGHAMALRENARKEGKNPSCHI